MDKIIFMTKLPKIYSEVKVLTSEMIGDKINAKGKLVPKHKQCLTNVLLSSLV